LEAVFRRLEALPEDLQEEENKMISYNPQVTDRSGEIMGQARAQASQTQAMAMMGFGENVAKAIADIGAGFQERESKKAKGRAFRGFMEVIGPSIGMDTAKLASISGKDSLKGDLDWYRASEMITPILPAMVNANIRTQQMGVQQAAPAFRAQTNAASQVAAGQGRVTAPPANINFDAIP